MKKTRTISKAILALRNIFLLGAMMVLPAAAHAQFTFITNNGAITITGYTGPGRAVTIPDTINGLPVTSIGEMVFGNCSRSSNLLNPQKGVRL